MTGANRAEFLRDGNSAEFRIQRPAHVACSDHLTSVHIEIFGEHPGLTCRHVTHLACETVLQFFLKSKIPRLDITAFQLLRQAREAYLAGDVDDAVPQLRGS